MSDDKKPAEAAAPAAGKKEGVKKGGVFGMILLMTIFGAALPFIYPTVFLLVGMVPTIVTMLTTNDRQGSAAMAVGALNFAGILPFVIELWQKGQTIGNAYAILSAPETWLVMFGAAAVGQLILFAVPQAIASATTARSEARVKLLKENLERLKAVWGPDVATTKPLAKVMRGE